MYFDTHAHYDDKRFDADRYEVLDALNEAGVELVVNAASNLDSAELATMYAERYSFIYASAGIHPHEAQYYDNRSVIRLEALCTHPKVVALGEIGLDYHYDFSPRDTQLRVLYAQMELAETLNLPVIFHDREAHEDSLNAVKRFPKLRGVFHCYSGSLEMARELISLGWYVSFTGSITFKNARKAPEIVAAIPNDRFFLETDAPYLAPVPKRGERNDSRNLCYIAEAVAKMRSVSLAEIKQQTLENAKAFFGINN